MALDLVKNNVTSWAEAGYTFELEIPGSYEKTGGFVTVRGTESKTAKAYLRKKWMELQRQETAKSRGKKVDEKSLDDTEEELAEMAITRIISWKGIQENGVDIPFTHENAMRILLEHSWIREQVLQESGNIENFRPGSTIPS